MVIADGIDTPWLTATEAGTYIKRSSRFVRREIKSGRMRGAVIGGHQQVLTRKEWCDAWVTERTVPKPIELPLRRRA